jgi:hypothetical protein
MIIPGIISKPPSRIWSYTLAQSNPPEKAISLSILPPDDDEQALRSPDSHIDLPADVDAPGSIPLYHLVSHTSSSLHGRPDTGLEVRPLVRYRRVA